MTLFATRLVNAYYRRDVNHSYFLGFSTGGGQALAEAQRYPEDYEGLVGGEPPNDRTGVHLSILWNFIAMHRTLEAYIPQAKALMIHKAVIPACEGQDGTKDGIIVDPRRCHFDPATLQCRGSNRENSLTAEQVKTVRLPYENPHNPKNDEPLYAGAELGCEEDWDMSFGRPGADVQPPFAPMFEWIVGTHWNWNTSDFDTQANEFIRDLGSSLNSLSPDLDKLKELGHKLLVSHEWEEPLVTPQASVNYLSTVVDRAQKEDRHSHNFTGSLDDYYRLFMIPGPYNCGQGHGADSFDPLSAMVNWVENGIAPDQIIATKYDQSGQPKFQRPLCPYSQFAQYRGKGDTNNAASFICMSPPSQRRMP